MSIAFEENSGTAIDESSSIVFDSTARNRNTAYSFDECRSTEQTQATQLFEAAESITETDALRGSQDDATSTLWSFDAKLFSSLTQHSFVIQRDWPGTQGRGYSWPKRINDILVNIDGELPAIAPQLIAVARRLAFYSDERALSHGLRVQPVIAPIDDGRVHVEWNRRGSVIRHVECTIGLDHTITFSLLTTLESKSGEVLRSSEIQNATMVEVLSEVENLLAKSMHES